MRTDDGRVIGVAKGGRGEGLLELSEESPLWCRVFIIINTSDQKLRAR